MERSGNADRGLRACQGLDGRRHSEVKKRRVARSYRGIREKMQGG